MNCLQKKTIYFLFIIVLLSAKVAAQAPLSFNYQGVALTNAGTAVVNKNISLQISLVESTQTGTVKYRETHTTTTDAFGQFSINIGKGQVVTGSMSNLQWNQYPYYLKVELDLNGGSSFVLVGNSQLLSVPYALYANNAGNALVGLDSARTVATINALSKKVDSLTNLISKVPTRIDSSSLYQVTPTIATKFLDSVFLPTINFDGNSSHILIGKTDLFLKLTRTFTIEGWVKNLGSTGIHQRILGNGSHGVYEGNRMAYSMGIYNNRLYVIYGTNLNGFNYSASVEYPNDGLWHHVANVFDTRNHTFIIYIDGIEKIRQNATFIPALEDISGGVAIGGNFFDGMSSPNNFFKGNLRKLRVSFGANYTSNFTPSYTYGKTDSTIAFWELNDLGTHIKANDSAYNGTLYNGTWSVLDTSSSVNLSRGLVAWYPFTGNAFDSSGFANHGTVNGATLTNDRFGNANNAYSFNGSTGYISVPNASRLNFDSGSFSISCWALCTGANKWQHILTKGDTPYPYREFYLRYTNNGIDFNAAFNSPPSTTFTSLFAQVENKQNWHQIVINYNTTLGMAFLYFDGVLKVQNPIISSVANTSGPMYIGVENPVVQLPSGPQYFTGKIDDIRIYNRPLTLSEITYLATH